MHDPFRRGQFSFARGRMRRLSGWQILLLFAVGLTLIIMLAIVAASAFLVLFPIILIGSILWRLLSHQKTKAQHPLHKNSHSDIIDAEYVILTDKRKEE